MGYISHNKNNTYLLLYIYIQSLLSEPSQSGSRVGSIVGGVFGAIIGLILIIVIVVVVVLLVLRWRNSSGGMNFRGENSIVVKINNHYVVVKPS